MPLRFMKLKVRASIIPMTLINPGQTCRVNFHHLTNPLFVIEVDRIIKCTLMTLKNHPISNHRCNCCQVTISNTKKLNLSSNPPLSLCLRSLPRTNHIPI